MFQESLKCIRIKRTEANTWCKRLQNEPCHEKGNRKAINRNWRNQKANTALKTKTGNK